ncbi:SNARE domain protein [Opisthorchis viverrini]|uniref:SNARE domain protein n=1 Tax=Opisthorchis viverrini TaxID=6198 RepID=A0A1S8WSS5_OPIVI|nr:SNARE domain protein [Opisthorchis viverrini]
MKREDSVVVAELRATEHRISKIRSEIDQFEQVFKRVTSGFGDDKYLNDEYHNLIVSTRDLSSHLAGLQRTIDVGAQDPDLRARAHNLNSQAMAQLRRLQNLGMRVQSHARQVSSVGPPDFQDKHASPLVDFTASEKPQQLQRQDQIASIQSEIDDQRAREMEQLESDIVQVNELFTTLATYVHEQGTLVDSIGDNIEVAYEKVEAGTRQLDTATKHRKSIRRKKCICIIVVVIILIIIATALGVSLRS